MATLKNKRKSVNINRDNPWNHSRKNQARNTFSPRIQESYFTQVSEKVEGEETKKLCQMFSRTESRNLRALSRLHEFFFGPTSPGSLRTRSGDFPEFKQRKPGNE